MRTQIIIKRSQDEVTVAVAEWLIESIQRVLQTRPTCSIALSGGGTPKNLYQHLASNGLQRIDWSKVQLFWGDERNVPPDHADSNFRMVREAWLDRALATENPGCIPNFFPVPVSIENPERTAKLYSDTLRHYLAADPSEGGFPRLDIVLLGLGDDSHTASLFPETQALLSKDEIFVCNYVPKLGTYRLTMTVPLLNAARQVAFLVCGASKQAAVEVVWHGPKQGNLYPAQRIQPQRGDLLWFMDLAAVPEHRRGDYAVR
ncbi:MAG: 6-phosphogluconolactonase [Planctomycetota bacterium]|jgi:6-phosphogluconolactonase